MACPKGATEDGFETQFGTNFLGMRLAECCYEGIPELILSAGHFLLFHLLKPTLLASSEPRFNSRVIGLSSSAHRAGVIQLDDLNFTKREYEPWAAYGQAKLAIIHFANELERRYSSQGMHALSLDPGNIVTPLQKHSPESREMMKVPEIAKFLKSPQQGAATTVWAAVAKEWEGRGGKFLNDCEEAVLNPVLGLTPGNGYSKYAFDPETEKALWIESLKLVGLEDDGSAKS
jgi:NAD(P)-dependent dehydrogenase (short-subunit alcohol dehydrogenase family)